MSSYDISYTYDGAGNRATKVDHLTSVTTTYTYDASNQLTLENVGGQTTTYTYDPSGNLTKKDAPSALTEYEWDAKNQMTTAKPIAGDVDFVYDYAGRRVQKTVGGSATGYIYDHQRLLQEIDADADTTSRLLTSTLDEYGDLISEFDGTSSNFYQYDALGSTEALLDANQAETDSYRYQAFGLQDHTGASSNSQTYVGRHGYERNEEIDLYLLGGGTNDGKGGRFYDPSVGRFVNEDPLGFRNGDSNLYLYVGNDPVNQIDPSGQFIPFVIPREDLLINKYLPPDPLTGFYYLKNKAEAIAMSPTVQQAKQGAISVGSGLQQAASGAVELAFDPSNSKAAAKLAFGLLAAKSGATDLIEGVDDTYRAAFEADLEHLIAEHAKENAAKFEYGMRTTGGLYPTPSSGCGMTVTDVWRFKLRKYMVMIEMFLGRLWDNPYRFMEEMLTTVLAGAVATPAVVLSVLRATLVDGKNTAETVQLVAQMLFTENSFFGAIGTWLELNAFSTHAWKGDLDADEDIQYMRCFNERECGICRTPGSIADRINTLSEASDATGELLPTALNELFNPFRILERLHDGPTGVSEALRPPPDSHRLSGEAQEYLAICARNRAAKHPANFMTRWGNSIREDTKNISDRLHDRITLAVGYYEFLVAVLTEIILAVIGAFIVNPAILQGVVRYLLNTALRTLRRMGPGGRALARGMRAFMKAVRQTKAAIRNIVARSKAALKKIVARVLKPLDEVLEWAKSKLMKYIGPKLAKHLDEIGDALFILCRIGEALSSCFPAGTLVRTRSGSVPIEELKAGDEVLSFDRDCGDWRAARIQETYVREYSGELVTLHVGGEKIQTTAGHPFWLAAGNELDSRPVISELRFESLEPLLRGRWVAAGDLVEGDVLLTASGELLPVESIEKAEVSIPVYNFHVARSRNFAVGECGILVHNMSRRKKKSNLGLPCTGDGDAPGKVGEYTTKIKWGIHDIDARPHGSGYWGKRIPQNDARVDAFELKINPNNESYYLPHPEGGFVQFENLSATALQDGKLIIKPKSIYHVDDLPAFAKNKVIAEAQRQVAAGKKAGLPVEWLVSDQKAVTQLDKLFKSKGIPISVKHFPE